MHIKLPTEALLNLLNLFRIYHGENRGETMLDAIRTFRFFFFCQIKLCLLDDV